MEKKYEKKQEAKYEGVSFDTLNLSENTMNAITQKGFKVASEIQAKAIPIIFEQKSDIIGIAQTGTGKTGAFGLPLIDLIETGNRLPQAIILAPTRELALQVTKELEMFTGKKRLNMLTVYGGSSITAQMKTLRRGVDIVVATPGRALDLLNRGALELNEVKHFILDEADEMLKMGFIEPIEEILAAASSKKRVYLFSATMPERIKQLSKKYMKKQVIIEVKKKQENNKLIEQSFYKSKQSDKFNVLTTLIDMESFFYGIIFCRTKADVDNVTASLKSSGHKVDCIHGDIAQNKREFVLRKFKELKLNILVATDVAARGIDVANLTHVINYSLPEDVETYTHRIGRTGRAGNKGKAISLVTQGEMRRISGIERVLKVKIQSARLPSPKELMAMVADKFVIDIDGVVEKVDLDPHKALAGQLLEKHEPEKVIAALLHKINGKKLEKKTVESFDNNSRNSRNSRDRGDRNSRGDRGNFREGGNRRTRDSRSPTHGTRLFIAKGNMDQIRDKRTLINWIERESRVRVGDVYDSKVCDKFSFMTVDDDIAQEVVDAFASKGGRRSIVEIAAIRK